jgi:acyl dehydratase
LARKSEKKKAEKSSTKATPKLDLRDLDKWIGKRIVYNEFWDPCSATDIRRWVQAMDYPNPIHWDEEFARKAGLETIVAPQSFTVCMDYGHGCHPAAIGNIPGSHLIFGGEEWWYYSGNRIRPGDKLTQERRLDGYSVAETKFAGPTVFTRGDTVHRNQHGALVAKERATAIRYLREEARKLGMYDRKALAPKRWSAEEHAKILRVRMDWILSNREGNTPHFDDVKVGDKLTRRVIGPHSIVTFALESRAHRQNIWGTYRWNAPKGVKDPARDPMGFSEDMDYDWDAREIDPRQGDGLYYGPSSGHINAQKGESVGMGGTYGYGSSMNAWFVDYVSYWAGLKGFVWHTNCQFRSPAFEGDVTFLDGEVVDKIEKSPYGMPVVQVKVKQTTQNGDVILSGTAEVELIY